jgi:hypothetical protein
MDLNPLNDKMTPQAQPALTDAPGDGSALGIAREALQFYANQEHFHMHDPDAWDTVSGEPQNFYEDASNTATVEDGAVAKMALEQIAGANGTAQCLAPDERAPTNPLLNPDEQAAFEAWFKSEWPLTFGQAMADASSEAAECVGATRSGYLAGRASIAPAQSVTAQSDHDEAVRLLGCVFDAWENGDDCHEGGDPSNTYMGKCFQLDDDVFQACCSLLNRLNQPRNVAPPPASVAAPAVAEGWKLVPIKMAPDHPAMIEVLIKAFDVAKAGGSLLWQDLWSDLLAAAPSAPVGGALLRPESDGKMPFLSV